MPLQIQTFPYGLLSQLGANSGGETPRQLGDAVAPVADLGPFWRSSLLGPRSASGNVTNVADAVIIGPSEREAWWLYAVQGSVQATTAGDAVKLSLLVSGQNNRIRIASHTQMQTAVQATARLPIAVRLPQPWLVLPGTSIEVFLDDHNLPGARSASVSIWAAILSI